MSDKHQTVAEIIRSATAQFVLREANTDPMITVTRVEVAPNFRQVQILFTTIPDNREADALAFLQRHGSDLRHYLKKETKLKRIPHLVFAVDYGERHRQHIDELWNDINGAEKDERL